MKEKEGYFKAYCNSKGTALSFYVERLSKTIDPKEIKSLKERICEFINDMDITCGKIGIISHPINNFDNNVLLLKKYNIPEVDSYLRRINYDYSYNYEYLNIIHNMKKNRTLSMDEIEFIEFILKYNFVKKEDKEILNNYFLRTIITRENIETTVSINAIKEIIISFIKSKLLSYIKNVKIKYSDKNDNEYMDLNINIGSDDLYKFYHSGDTTLFLSIFSQIYKVNANKCLYGKFDNAIYDELKDDVLCRMLPLYEKENEDIISYNINSKKYAIEEYTKLINSFNLKFKDNSSDPFAKEKEILNKMITNDRMYDGQKKSIDDIFAKTMENYFEILEKQPELSSKLSLLMGNDYIKRGRFTI